MSDEKNDENPAPPPPPPPAPPAAPKVPRPPRWRRDVGRFVFTLDEKHCSRLRELPAWSDKSEDAVAEEFLQSQGDRWLRSLDGVREGAELRVMVDQFSRQAFVVDGEKVIHVESF